MKLCNMSISRPCPVSNMQYTYDRKVREVNRHVEVGIQGRGSNGSLAKEPNIEQGLKIFNF